MTDKCILSRFVAAVRNPIFPRSLFAYFSGRISNRGIQLRSGTRQEFRFPQLSKVLTTSSTKLATKFLEVPPRKIASAVSAPRSIALFARMAIVLFGLIGPLNSVGSLSAQTVAVSEVTKAAPKFDEDQSFAHLEDVCAFGRRLSGSRGMRQQQDYLRKHFQSLGAEVFMQPFIARDPRDGSQAQLANMIVRFHPHRSKRLLLCCHYDTRPFPDRDRRNPHGVFIGANDGGSGVAILCELGRHMQRLSGESKSDPAKVAAGALEGQPKTDDGKYGIDFAFFDGEEFVYVARRDPMFLGSTHFANQYARTGHPPESKVSFDPPGQPPAVRPANSRYVFAILIDMVGDKNLQIYYEGNSLTYAPRLTKSIWDVAARMKIKEFIPKQKHNIRDDHLPLNQIARIPTCDIIDFDFPSARRKHAYWHTEADVVKNCSAKSLGSVGSVLLQWLNEMQQLAQSHPSN